MNPQTTTGPAPQISVVPGDVMQKFVASLQDLTTALEQKLPEIHAQCFKINEQLRQYPEIASLLTEEQIGQMMRGVIQESNIQFTMAASGRKTKDPLKNVNAAAVNLDEVQL